MDNIKIKGTVADEHGTEHKVSIRDYERDTETTDDFEAEFLLRMSCDKQGYKFISFDGIEYVK